MRNSVFSAIRGEEYFKSLPVYIYSLSSTLINPLHFTVRGVFDLLNGITQTGSGRGEIVSQSGVLYVLTRKEQRVDLIGLTALLLSSQHVGGGGRTTLYSLTVKGEPPPPPGSAVWQD